MEYTGVTWILINSLAKTNLENSKTKGQDNYMYSAFESPRSRSKLLKILLLYPNVSNGLNAVLTGNSIVENCEPNY